MCRKLFFLASFVLVLGLASAASAATVAYWRFGDGDPNAVANSALPDSDGWTVWRKAVNDDSGNGNHLTTWDFSYAGFNWRIGGPNVPATTVPSTGASNNLSIQNAGSSPASMTWSAQSAPSGTDIETITPAAFTVEASFKATALQDYSTIVGRDGMNVWTKNVGTQTSPQNWAPFYFTARASGLVRVQFHDLDGYQHTAESVPGLVKNNKWYHMVAVSDGSTLKLYLDDVASGKGFQLVDQNDMTTSGSADTRLAIGSGSGSGWQAGTWTVGRGLWNGNHVDRVFGYIDEVRISDTALKPSEFLFAKAYNPSPPSGGAYDGDSVTLMWTAASYAAKHDVYFADKFTDVNDAKSSDPNGPNYVYKGRFEPNNYFVSSITRGKIYYWRIDEVNGPNIWRGAIWSFRVKPPEAWDPSPYDGEDYVFTDPNLSWNAGINSTKSKVYLGTSPGSLTLQTTITHTVGVERYSYVKTGLLNNQDYYWQVDEVPSTGPDVTGNVWHFKTTPPGIDPNLKGWWKFDDGTGTRVIDWSGQSHHGTVFGSAQWVAGKVGGALQFDGIDDYVSLPIGSLISSLKSTTITAWVNFSNTGNQWQRIFDFGNNTNVYMFMTPNNGNTGALRFAISTGSYYDPYEYRATASSVLPTGWHHVAVVLNSVGSKCNLYLDAANLALVENNTLMFPNALGATANNWLGRSQYSADAFFNGMLDDFRIYNRVLTQDEIGRKIMSPSEAWLPDPANGATGIEPILTLNWKPGNQAAEHDVYFSDNFDDVNDANSLDQSGPTEIYRGRQDANDYPIPEALKWGQIYYWRVDEVNDANTWRGNVWSFTVRNYIVVDGFEDYNNTSGNTIIWEKWKASSTGKVGYSDPNYAERSITHGDLQSMPFDYNNTKSPYYSDANRTFDSPQNWAASGSNVLKILSLWFRGYPERIGSFSYTGTANPYAATMYACGTDIGNVADLRHPSLFHDECHFGYKEATAATTTTLPGTTTTFVGVKIIAKVESIGNPGDTVGKAGVMIRDSLDANSVSGFMCVRRTAANTYGVLFEYRSTAKGGSTTQTDVNSTGTVDAGITLPCWVALTLQTPAANRNLRAYYSKNGTNWYQLGTVQQFPSGTMTLPRTPGVYIGLAATPQSNTATRIAKFSSVSIYAGAGLVNWKYRDIGIKSNAAAPLYVTLRDSNSNTATVTHPNPYMVQRNTWQQWEIPLSDFAGVDLTNIKKITIGTGNGSSSSGAGTLYFDDIRVYVPRCVANAVAPDFTGSGCVVDNQDLRILTDNWLINEYQVTPATGWDPNNDVNLVARYRFDGNYNDSKGTNNGDPCNTSVAIVNDATRGQVASFDGVNSYIALRQMDGNDFTLSAWIKASTPGAQAGTRAYQGSGLIWSDVAGNSNDFILAVLGTKLSSATGPSTNDITSIGDVATGQWVHVAMVRTRSTGKVELYINGMLDRASLISSSTGSLTANSRILIGANTLDGYYYKGLVDDVWIYDRALTAAQVARLAGKATAYNVPVSAQVTNTAVNLYNDGRIDIRDYAILASKWLETLLWAP